MTTFQLVGEALGAWVNGVAVKPGATFRAEANAGINVLVLQLSAEQTPTAVKLSSGDVSFGTN